MALDVIKISGIEANCIVGIFPQEKLKVQPLIIDVQLFLDTRQAAASGQLRHTIDYHVLAGELRFLLEAGHFGLLETAAEALCAYLLAPPIAQRPQAKLHKVKLTIKKPQALAQSSVASLTISRTYNEMTYREEQNDYGVVDILHENSDCGIYRLKIPAGGYIPLHHHQEMCEAEIPMTAGLLLQNAPAVPGVACFWPKGFAHRYDNPTPNEGTILCVDRPAFIPKDEIPVDNKPLESLPETIKIRYYSHEPVNAE